MEKGKKIFVTVGTTHFDDLVEAVLQDNVLEALTLKGYSSLRIQFGKGNYIPKEGKHHCGMEIETFKYKPSLAEDFERSDLVISHAGAGSCIEALEKGKPLIAVINHSLMNNHQTELAEALAGLGYSKCCYTNTLQSTIEELDVKSLTAYKPGHPKKLVEYIDSVFKINKLQK